MGLTIQKELILDSVVFERRQNYGKARRVARLSWRLLNLAWQDFINTPTTDRRIKLMV